MFNLFKKKAAVSEPHPLKIHFAKTYLPGALRDMRTGFVNAMASDEQSAWRPFSSVQADSPISQRVR